MEDKSVLENMKQNLLTSLKGTTLYITLCLGVGTIMRFLQAPAFVLILVFPLIISFMFIGLRLLVLNRFSFRWVLQTFFIGLIIFIIFFLTNIFFVLGTHESEFLIIFNPMMASILYVALKIQKYSRLYIAISQVIGNLILLTAILLVIFRGSGGVEGLMLINFAIGGIFAGVIIGLLKDVIVLLKIKLQATKGA